jgi:hypothetical protein
MPAGGWGGRFRVVMVRLGWRLGVDGDWVVAVAVGGVGFQQRVADVVGYRLAGAVQTALLDPAT